MSIQPTVSEAMRRLRLDTELEGDVSDAINQARAEAEAAMDGTLYADQAAMQAAGDPRGIVIKPDIIAAQLLLVDVLVGNNSMADRDSKRSAALSMLHRHKITGV